MALIDRVRLVLASDPDAPVSCVCWCVGDSRPELVATLMRMVTLAGLRGSVATTDTVQSSAATSTRRSRGQTTSLPVSSTGAGPS